MAPLILGLVFGSIFTIFSGNFFKNLFSIGERLYVTGTTFLTENCREKRWQTV
jgi:hypothetical protein